MPRRKKNIEAQQGEQVVITLPKGISKEQVEEFLAKFIKTPLDILNGELPIIKERFANLLDNENIKILAATKKNNIIYGLVTDSKKIIIIKRMENGNGGIYITMGKGVYDVGIFMELVKGVK